MNVGINGIICVTHIQGVYPEGENHQINGAPDNAPCKIHIAFYS